MPRPDALPTAAGGFAGAARASLADAVAVLTDPALAGIVELAVSRAPVGEPGPAGGLVVANAAGACLVDLAQPSGPREVLRGRDPLTRADPLAFTPGAAEGADPHPPAERNHYPFAGLRLASLFADAERAPDVAVVHTDAHYWPERGGHLGEHGSLGVLQSRAPLLLSGAGVVGRGLVAAAARTVDVGPTLAALAGVPRAALAGLDGRVLDAYLDPQARPAHVVGLLWDGANCSDVLTGAYEGWLPAVARLLEAGCALTGGAVAEFPSNTLVNHTSALTGLGPGRHGVVHNVFYDRRAAREVLANDSAHWHTACDLLRPGVATVWEHVVRHRPGTPTACVNEPVDRGAGYSTFGLVRAAGTSDGARSLSGRLPDVTGDPLASAEFLARPDYSWSSQVDALGLAQMLTLWSSAPPALTWWNTTLTDTGHHAGGPRSPVARAALRDADARLGVWLDQVERLGLLAGTSILLTADHGSAAADPGVRGDWDVALRAAGISARDCGYGFCYLER